MVRKRLESVTADAPAQEDAAPSKPAEPAPEEYEVRRQALLAKLPPWEERPKTLIGKLALITSLVGEVRKTGENKHFGYKFAREADLLEAIRPLMSELGVWLHSTLSWDEPKVQGVTDDTSVVRLRPRWVGHQRVKINEHSEVESLTILMVQFYFVDAESGQRTEPQIYPGYGDDVGDKGAYKALTGVTKYFLMKTFLVATGDDPEADSRADERAAGQDAKTRVIVGKASGEAAAHGGHQKQASRPQIRALGEALRAKGVATQEAAIEALQSLTGKEIKVEEGADLNAVITTFMASLSADEIGAAIQKAKEGGLDNLSQGSETLPAPDPVNDDANKIADQGAADAEPIEDALGE